MAERLSQNGPRAAAADAMEIDWMTKAELNDAIPPAYTEYVGRCLMAELNMKAAA